MLLMSLCLGASAGDKISSSENRIGHSAEVVSTKMTPITKGFAAVSEIGDMYQVQAGKVAQKRSQTAAVKDFAARMVAAHIDTTNKLKFALASTPPDITPLLHLDDGHLRMIANLRSAKDMNFDTQYIAQQVAANRQALDLMRVYVEYGDTQAIKTFALKTALAIQIELNQAEKIRSGINKKSKGKPASTDAQ